MSKILLADDQADVLEALRFLLKGEGFAIETAASPEQIITAIEKSDFDVVLMDLNYTRDTTSGREGLDLLSRIQLIDSTLPVVVMTAWGSVDLAVEAMRYGARDFIQKPWENERLITILRTQTALSRELRKSERLEEENRILRNEMQTKMIAESPVMMPVLQMIARVGPSDANVLVTGENGTGKGVVASILHSISIRASKPFVTVNVGGLPEGVFEGELFGHIKGAFTDAKNDRVGRFEAADGGTLFLDEIANIGLPQQAKLLRVLETGEFERIGSSKTRKVNVRIVSATNADLKQDVADGKFRRDLLFRLNTVEIHLPPLRDRQADIPLLAGHFLNTHATRYRKNISGFDKNSLQLLSSYQWPGNVRELDHVVERAVLMTHGDVIRSSDLGISSLSGDSKRMIGIDDMSLEEVEEWLINKALARCEGNVSKAADALGLSRSALYRRLEKFNAKTGNRQ